jgi:uncharacterized protein YdhG (YjbR/CyaY superfamily)
MTQKKDRKKSTKSTTANNKKSKGFTDEEKAAMKERAKELKAEASANKKKEEGEKDLLEKIAEMTEPDRTMAERLHAIITTNAPDLWPKTWYGMPAYARDGNAVSFCQTAEKYHARHATLGFNDTATLEDGAMWPTAFALKELTSTAEAKIVELVKKAVS